MDCFGFSCLFAWMTKGSPREDILIDVRSDGDNRGGVGAYETEALALLPQHFSVRRHSKSLYVLICCHLPY